MFTRNESSKSLFDSLRVTKRTGTHGDTDLVEAGREDAGSSTMPSNRKGVQGQSLKSLLEPQKEYLSRKR
jgi:hypothetical protein